MIANGPRKAELLNADHSDTFAFICFHRSDIFTFAFIDPACLQGQAPGSSDRPALPEHRLPQHVPDDVPRVHQQPRGTGGSQARLQEPGQRGRSPRVPDVSRGAVVRETAQVSLVGSE